MMLGLIGILLLATAILTIAEWKNVKAKEKTGKKNLNLTLCYAACLLLTAIVEFFINIAWPLGLIAGFFFTIAGVLGSIRYLRYRAEAAKARNHQE